MKKWLIPILALITSTACAGREDGESALLLQDHPLAGRIWSVGDQSFVEPERVLAQAQTGDYVLLGETHDNPRHHGHQADMLNALAAPGRNISVVLEMLTESQAADLAGSRPGSADAFFDAVDWEGSGWPPRALYRPVIGAALRAGMPLYPGNLDRDFLRSVIGRGAAAVPVELRDYMNDASLDTAALRSMRADIMASHCDMLPDDMVDRMLLGQRTRDAVMARSLIEHRDGGTGVLIAGSGHVRNDHGVPVYLAGREPGATIVTVAWVEVRQDFTAPQDYAGAWNADVLPFDYVWFTPRVNRPDPCAELKARHRDIGR